MMGAIEKSKNFSYIWTLCLICLAKYCGMWLNGHVDIAQLLTSYQCDLNAVCKNGDTALHFAAYGGSIETVKLLIKKGALLNQPNQDMLTPIHEAAMKGHIEVVKYLINNVI